MPANDGNTAVWYMILDENDGEIAFEHQNLHYDFGLTSSLMLDNGLQKNMLRPKRYLGQHGDSSETEIQQQGQQIQF
jgi:hypothetical protein